MTVSYSVTDSTGLVHTRKSARHLAPLYPFAVVRKPGNPRKTYVSFHGSYALARAALTQAASQSYEGRRTYPDAELVRTESRVHG